MPINGHCQNMLSGASNGLLSVCVNNATSASNAAKVITSLRKFVYIVRKLRVFKMKKKKNS